MSELDVAEVIGAYRVLDVLGHGAMGMVYRAHDPRLDRDVALKLVHPGRVAKDASKARARLVAEARALARVSHPNVLAVYDVGVHDDLVYVALELVDGVDLAQWLRMRARPWPEVVRVFAEAAAGLAAVHAAGLVHRDVKPANILVERTKGRAHGRVLVADFGIARSTIELPPPSLPGELDSTDSGEDTRLTEAGRVVGTPVYMAPEQHLGHDVGPSADQYALCVALFEALAGQRPFRGNAQALLHAKMKPREEPAPAHVPAWLWAIALRGLSPLPRDRFAAMGELVAALRAGSPRRKWLVRASVSLGVLAGGSALVWSFVDAQPCRTTPPLLEEAWSAQRRDAIGATFAASERPNAVQTWERVAAELDGHAQTLSATYREACEAALVRHEQSEALFDRQVVCLDNRTQALARVVALLAKGDADLVDHADEVAASLGPIAACNDLEALEAGLSPPRPEQRQAVAEVRRGLADASALQAAGRYDDAASAAIAAVALAREVGYAPVLVDALHRTGEIRERQSRIDDARRAFEEVVSTGMAIGYDEPVARAAVMLTWIAGEYDRDIASAEKWGALGRAQLARVGDPILWVLALHNSLGTAFLAASRSDDAIREFEQGLALAEGHREVAEMSATLRSNLGGVYFKRGELDRALESFRAARDQFRVALGEDHPNAVGAEIRLGQTLTQSGRDAEGIAALRRAIASLERMQAPPVERSVALNALGAALRRAGDGEEANATFKRAVELLGDTTDVVTLGQALVGFGGSCVDLGVYDAAERQYQRAADLLEPVDAASPDLVTAWIGLGRIRELQSRPDEALSLYRRALAAAPAQTRSAARALVAVAGSHGAAGRFDEAEAALDEQDAILAVAPLVLSEDRLVAATARVKLMTDAGRANEASVQLDALAQLLAERAGGVLWSGEAGLALGRARLARGELDAARAALGRALEQLERGHDAGLVAQARTALAACERRR